ncbi:MAG: 30S ribosomal protein S6 [Myxococcota bacterium]|nr:30S ribosomal protein S6 [Myxococcota bacterium]
MAADKLRRYELIYLIEPEAEDDTRQNVSESMAKILAESDATIIKNEEWGKRKLAYEIQKVNKAYYHYIEFISKPGASHEMERVLRTSFQGVCIRYQTIKLEDGIHPNHVERYLPAPGAGQSDETESSEVA